MLFEYLSEGKVGMETKAIWTVGQRSKAEKQEETSKVGEALKKNSTLKLP